MTVNGWTSTSGRGSMARMTDTAARVKRFRTDKGLTQQDLAVAAGITVTSVYRIEAGRQAPSLTLARDLAKALGVTIDELIGEAANDGQQEAPA